MGYIQEVYKGVLLAMKVYGGGEGNMVIEESPRSIRLTIAPSTVRVGIQEIYPLLELVRIPVRRGLRARIIFKPDPDELPLVICEVFAPGPSEKSVEDEP